MLQEPDDHRRAIRRASSATRRPAAHWRWLPALMICAAVVQAVSIQRATVPSLDAVRFVGIAREIQQHGVARVARAEGEQPLFPAWVAAVHGGLEKAVGPSPSLWATSVHLAAAIPLVLTLPALYWLLARLVGGPAALAGAALFGVLPEVTRLGADGLSDSPHVLLFCLSLAATVEYFTSSRRRWLLLAGVSGAFAVLARAESLVLGAVVTVALLTYRVGGTRRSRCSAIGCFLLGWAVVLGPYLAAVGAFTPKDAAMRLLGRHASESPEASPILALPDGSPGAFDLKEPSRSIRRRGIVAAIERFGKELAAAFGYWIGLVGLWGLWRLRQQGQSDAQRLVTAFFVAFSLITIGFSASEGYLEARHLLPLVVAGMGSVGHGAVDLGQRLASRFAPARPEAVRSCFAWATVALLAASCLPRALAPLHDSHLGHREAAAWLAAAKDVRGPQGRVLDSRGWTGLYSGRETYTYDRAATAFSDPRLRYVVIEAHELDYPSDRSRTLRTLLAASGRRVAEFPAAADDDFQGERVWVFRWNPR